MQPTGAPAMALSWRNAAVVTTDTIDTIADGVAGRFPIPEVLDDLLEVVDDVVLVDDPSIKDGMRHLSITPASSWSRPQHSASPPCSRIPTASAGVLSPRSSAAATSQPPTSAAGRSTSIRPRRQPHPTWTSPTSEHDTDQAPPTLRSATGSELSPASGPSDGSRCGQAPGGVAGNLP